MPASLSATSSRRFLGTLAAALFVISACGGGTGGDKGKAASASPGSGANQSASLSVAASPAGRLVAGPNGEPARVPFDPANFVDPTTSTNQFHPLRPGTQWVRAGTTEVGSRKVPHQVISTMTDVVRTIDGVTVVAMLDQSTDSGEIAQVGFDWFALDKDGNVWILGAYTEDYEGGVYTNTDTPWLGKATGGDPGILVPGQLDMTTPRWFVGSTEAGSKGSVAEPAEVGVSRCVKFGCFDNVLVTREGEAGAIDNELKYYAPGVGVIDNVPHGASLHQDTFQLVNVVQLSPQGLAEISQIVLDLEVHAQTTAPAVYGGVPLATRKP